MQEQLFDAGTVRISHRGVRTYPSQAGECKEPGCGNRARAVQGARYCEEHARRNGYNPFSGTEPATCIRCGKDFGRRPHRGVPQTPSRRAWTMFCPECRRESPLVLERLRNHRVPYELAVQWLLLGDQLRCEVCDRRLRRKAQGTAPTIDHDHRCCNTERSCGKCIRGILCVRCNTLIGGYERLALVVDPEKLRSYLNL